MLMNRAIFMLTLKNFWIHCGNQMTTEPYSLNLFYQTMIEGVQEVIGLPNLKTVESVRVVQELGDSAGVEEKTLFYQFASWMAALEQVFGRRSGQGIALRGGRVWFLYLSHLPELWNAFSNLVKQLLACSGEDKRRWNNG